MFVSQTGLLPKVLQGFFSSSFFGVGGRQQSDGEHFSLMKVARMSVPLEMIDRSGDCEPQEGSSLIPTVCEKHLWVLLLWLRLLLQLLGLLRWILFFFF